MDRSMTELFQELQNDPTTDDKQPGAETNEPIEKYPDGHIQYVFVEDIRNSEGNLVGEGKEVNSEKMEEFIEKILALNKK